jgi:lysozyme
MRQNMGNSLREMIKMHEGLRLKPYQCTAGRWTIGYGHNLDAHGEAKPESITLAQAERYLDADMASAETQCRARIPFFSYLDEVRQAVLIDMCFNLGINGLLAFKKTLADIERGNYSFAAANMLDSKWATQVKYRAKRLANMMSNGKWATDIPMVSAAA